MASMTSHVLVASSPYFSSDHTPVHNSEQTKNELKHKRKYKKFSKISNTYNMMLNLKIINCNEDVRVEYLCIPFPSYISDMYPIILSVSNNFSSKIFTVYNIPIRVVEWDSAECKLELVLNAHITADVSSLYVVELLKHDDLFEKEHSNLEYRLYLSDDYDYALSTGHGINRIEIISMEPKSHELIAPNHATCVEAQNICGYCILPYEITWSCFEKVLKRKRSMRYSNCEAISTTSGSYVLTNLKFKIDFRGVRATQLLEKDIKLLTNIEFDEVQSFVYMMVLKANIGKGMFLKSNSEITYLSRRISDWCTCELKFEDVCDVMEISCIDWLKLKTRYPSIQISDKVQRTKSFYIFISRKGGAILRLTFHKKNLWNLVSEQEVLCDCNKLVHLLKNILNGKP